MVEAYGSSQRSLRLADALLKGALLGATLTSVAVSLPFLAWPGYALLAVVVGFIISFCFWLIGLWVMAAPIWWLIERLGGASQAAAIALGAALSSVAAMGLFGMVSSPRGFDELSQLSGLGLIFALLGAFVGWRVWRVLVRGVSG